MNISILKSTAILLLCTLCYSSCTERVIAPDDYGIFAAENDSTVVMNGVIDSDTPQHWENYIAAYPNTLHIIMEDCPGSMDDAANLVLGKDVYNDFLSIHLPANAEIASGAVDFFLAGAVRTREAGSKIGVHAWSTTFSSATDYPNDHEEHQPYIDYYVDIGFSQSEAENFYFFTINAAPANGMHWMTDEEIATYNMLTP